MRTCFCLISVSVAICSFCCSFSSRPSRPCAYSSGQLQVTQEDFADDDAVGAEAGGDGGGGGGAEFFALGGEYFASDVVGRKLAVDGGYRGRDDFRADRLGQIRVDIGQTLGIEAIADADGEADVETFASLDD